VLQEGLANRVLARGNILSVPRVHPSNAQVVEQVLVLCHRGRVDNAFPSPTLPADSRAEVFVSYLDYFRGTIIAKTEGLSEDERRSSRLPSGWTPLELLKHLTFVELRWLEWGFEGRRVEDPWGDRRNGRWWVAPEETVEELIAALRAQAARTRAVTETTDLDSVASSTSIGHFRWFGQRGVHPGGAAGETHSLSATAASRSREARSLSALVALARGSRFSSLSCDQS